MPSVSRFVNKDPIGFAGGLNLYGYVGNEPINSIDPLGLWYVDISISGGWWVGGAGGVLIGPEGIYVYTGGGGVSPGLSGAIMWSPHDPVTGWNMGLQVVGGIAYQKGQSLNKCNNGKSWEIGIGISYPTFWGASLTTYHVNKPWQWPWRRNK